jgi:hypothetical protein
VELAVVGLVVAFVDVSVVVEIAVAWPVVAVEGGFVGFVIVVWVSGAVVVLVQVTLPFVAIVVVGTRVLARVVAKVIVAWELHLVGGCVIVKIQAVLGDGVALGYL